MAGWKDWAIGEVVTEGEFQSFIQDQVVQRYADATARDTTLGANVAEGMVAYLEDTNQVQVYNGTDWVAVGEGDITAVTAGTALTGGGTSGDVTLNVDLAAVDIPASQITDLTATAAELNTLDGITSTTAELNFTDGVTSNIQTQLNAKADDSDFTGGTAGFTAVSNGSSGLSYQPVSHNYIINGAFDNWQRGTSLSGALADNVYLADRWKNIWTGAGNPTDVTVSQETFTPAEVEAIGYGEGQFYQEMTITTIGSAAGYRIEHDIEDVRTLAGQEVTISFWVKANASHSITGQPFQLFGSGGSTPVSNSPFTFSQTTTSTTWTRVTGTTTISSISGKTIGTGSKLLVRLDFGTDADGDEISIWGVQLEAGSIATPFKRNANNIQGELAACQRYFYRLDNQPNAGRPAANVAYYTTTSAFGVVFFPTIMRATPSVVFTNVLAWNVLSSGVGRPTSNLFLNNSSEAAATIGFVTSATVVGHAGWAESLTGQTGSINFSAEL